MPWLDLYMLLFWLLFLGFFISYTNVLHLLILGEVFWVIITTYLMFLSSLADFYFLYFITIYLYVLATSETTIGLSLISLKNSLLGTVTLNNYFLKNYFFLRKRLTKNVSSRKL